MANKTIPQLPEQTGKTNDDLLVIVDSGETTTSKIKVSTLLSGVGGTSYFSADTTNILQIDRGHSIVYGDPSNVVDYNFLLGGSGNTIDMNTRTGINSSRCVIIGGLNNRIFPGSNSRPNDQAAIVGGENLTFGRESSNSILLGGLSNSIGYGYRSAIVGGESNSFSQNDIFIGGGFSNSVLNSYSGIIAGYDNYLRSNRSFIGGGTSHNIQAYGNVNNGIIGGNSHDVDVVNNTFIGGGDTHILRTADRSAIIGGQNHTLSGHTNSVIIGGSGFTSNHNDEVIVPALTIANYASLDFASDALAAAGGVPLGGVYHNAGALRVRIV
jgi:hypothetical protein